MTFEHVSLIRSPIIRIEEILLLTMSLNSRRLITASELIRR